MSLTAFSAPDGAPKIVMCGHPPERIEKLLEPASRLAAYE
jgi:hypothetical protein